MERFKNLKNYLKDVLRRVLPVSFYYFLSVAHYASTNNQQKLYYKGDMESFVLFTIRMWFVYLFGIVGVNLVNSVVNKAYPPEKKGDKYFIVEVLMVVLFMVLAGFLVVKWFSSLESSVASPPARPYCALLVI